MRADRAELVERVLRERRASGPGADPILRRASRGPAPLSAAQRRLWILHQLEPGSSGSNRPLGLTLSGPLDQAALAGGLDEILRRHEALRTTFPEVGGEPVQSIQPAAGIPLPLIDLHSLPEPERAAEARRIARMEVGRPFDLARGPVVRAVLLRLDQQEHLLLLLMHHIVFDGWSQGVLIRELSEIYEAFAAGRSSPLSEPAIQHSDFAAWEREQLEAGRLQEDLRYWRERLQPLPPPLALTTDFPMPSGPRVEGAEVRFRLSPQLSARLREWCRAERVTPFMALLSAFQLLLGRYARQHEFLFGVPVAGRNRAETEELVGCFMNIMLMRADLTGNPSFCELVGRTRAQTLDSYAHQELPFERLVQELQPERRPNRWPLFDVLFNLRNVPNATLDSAGTLRIGIYPFDRVSIEGLSLSLQFEHGSEGFNGSLGYAAELFRPETMHRLAENFIALLTAGLEQPDRPAALLPLVAGAESRALLHEWNRTDAAYDRDACAHQLIGVQAARAPGAIAVSSPAGQLDYRELDRRSNRLAHRLRELGVGPDVIVAVYLERSPE
ncbi:MAG: AMP-binding protein, partial [Gemmatimonadales bacterium]|nr:AMP-binding protein [Gemmatimonadales bacterium]